MLPPGWGPLPPMPPMPPMPFLPLMPFLPFLPFLPLPPLPPHLLPHRPAARNLARALALVALLWVGAGLGGVSAGGTLTGQHNRNSDNNDNNNNNNNNNSNRTGEHC